MFRTRPWGPAGRPPRLLSNILHRRRRLPRPHRSSRRRRRKLPYPAQPQDTGATPQYTGTPAPIRQPRTITIATGTNLAVRLSQTLTTDRNLSGDTFRAALENPIILDGAIIADRGSRVVGRVVEAQKAGRVEGLADLTLALTEINTTDGQRVSIATNTFR